MTNDSFFLWWLRRSIALVGAETHIPTQMHRAGIRSRTDFARCSYKDDCSDLGLQSPISGRTLRRVCPGGRPEHAKATDYLGAVDKDATGGRAGTQLGWRNTFKGS